MQERKWNTLFRPLRKSYSDPCIDVARITVGTFLAPLVTVHSAVPAAAVDGGEKDIPRQITEELLLPSGSRTSPTKDASTQTILSAKKLATTQTGIHGGRHITAAAFTRFLTGTDSISIFNGDAAEIRYHRSTSASNLSDRYVSTKTGPVPILQNPRQARKYRHSQADSLGFGSVVAHQSSECGTVGREGDASCQAVATVAAKDSFQLENDDIDELTTEDIFHKADYVTEEKHFRKKEVRRKSTRGRAEGRSVNSSSQAKGHLGETDYGNDRKPAKMKRKVTGKELTSDGFDRERDEEKNSVDDEEDISGESPMTALKKDKQYKIQNTVMQRISQKGHTPAQHSKGIRKKSTQVAEDVMAEHDDLEEIAKKSVDGTYGKVDTVSHLKDSTKQKTPARARKSVKHSKQQENNETDDILTQQMKTLQKETRSSESVSAKSSLSSVSDYQLVDQTIAGSAASVASGKAASGPRVKDMLELLSESLTTPTSSPNDVTESPLFSPDVPTMATDSLHRNTLNQNTRNSGNLRKRSKLSMETQTAAARASSGFAGVDLAYMQKRLADQEEFFSTIMQGTCEKCHRPLKHMELTDLFKHKLLHRNTEFMFDPEHFCCPEFQKELEKLLFARGTFDAMADRRSGRRSGGSEDHGPKRRRSSSKGMRHRSSTAGSLQHEAGRGHRGKKGKGKTGHRRRSTTEKDTAGELAAIERMLRQAERKSEEKPRVTEDNDDDSDEDEVDIDNNTVEELEPSSEVFSLKKRRTKEKRSLKAVAASKGPVGTSKLEKGSRRSSKVGEKDMAKDAESNKTTHGGLHTSKKKFSSSLNWKTSVSGSRRTSYTRSVSGDFPDNRYKGNTMSWALSSYACNKSGWTLRKPVPLRTKSYLLKEKPEHGDKANEEPIKSKDYWPLLPTAVIHWYDDMLASEFTLPSQPTGYYPYLNGRTAFVTAEYQKGQSIVAVFANSNTWSDLHPVECPVSAIIDTGSFGIIFGKDVDWMPLYLVSPDHVRIVRSVFDEGDNIVNWEQFQKANPLGSHKNPAYNNGEISVDIIGPKDINVQLTNDAMRIRANCGFRKTYAIPKPETRSQAERCVTVFKGQLASIREKGEYLTKILAESQAYWTQNQTTIVLAMARTAMKAAKSPMKRANKNLL
ncbi:uncharacterized protein LOC129585813 isoform X2 [Paramacrobiotus metropolitanus]|nr:uncharacterized protein LOC129585813 isoform X2 [Paramacrobiotus metropolitanus]XP_055334658.1 uncharacterized protein LOC129585813 isoform X2 [Paramacrobiotus metropolitanus]XP_055334659.1 uncharacterized protein LOC129585813 isoform X2 [Paramacrobiotus metropolitanus]XP_055334660.1 uncharacterized protein LOC129585813 isoform X2 [Paramacrobiotus metropolitanus]